LETDKRKRRVRKTRGSNKSRRKGCGLHKVVRIHATFLVFHNGHIIAFSNKLQIPFLHTIMPTHSQQSWDQNDRGSGEEFSDVGPDTDDESVVQIQDNWTFPVVPHKARRE